MKSMNMRIWEIDALYQLSITAFYTEIKFSKNLAM